MNFEELNKRVDQGYLRRVYSPCNKLVLWNYTDACTYDRAWNETTLNARGTTYEIESGNVIARAFPKFFNFGELDLNKQQALLANNNFTVYEKMDGSLGIIYYYDGEWRVNTRGSFTSDQAIKAKEMLSKYNMDNIPKNYTLLAEIIYPDNRIIVDYGDTEELVILGVYDIETGSEKDIISVSSLCNMRHAPMCTFDTIEGLQEHLETLGYDEEGYVVKFHNGERVKFKSAEYLRLARILSNMSPLAFWEKMDYGKINRDFIQELPEEFRDECDIIAGKLEDQFKTVVNDVAKDFSYCAKSIGYDGELTPEIRKELGLFLKKESIEHSGAMFSMLLENDQAVMKYAKKLIRPTGNKIVELQ